MGRIRQPNGRRNGACVGERDLSVGRGVRELGEAARSQAGGRDRAAMNCEKESPMKRVLLATTVLAVSTLAIGIAAPQVVLPGQPHARFGDGVTPAYEGWFDGPDGARNLLFGYYNRNSEQEF